MVIALTVFASLVVLPSMGGMAGLGSDSEEGALETRIWEGEAAESCQWPTVAMMLRDEETQQQLCTGTLVHPRLLLYAAHCGTRKMRAFLGDEGSQSVELLVEECQTNPGAEPDWAGGDWAWCKLVDPLPLPVTPIAYGCEKEQYLYNGATGVVVGFGVNEEDEDPGIKRWGEAVVSGLSVLYGTFEISSELGQGDGGSPASSSSVCAGDSGGPLLIRHEDGGWRTFGIASAKASDSCDEGKATYAIASDAVPWIEASSGLDVTPCFDAKTRRWEPGPDCGAFSAGERGKGGDRGWDYWCEGGSVSGWSEACGVKHEDWVPPPDESDGEPEASLENGSICRVTERSSFLSFGLLLLGFAARRRAIRATQRRPGYRAGGHRSKSNE